MSDRVYGKSLFTILSRIAFCVLVIGACHAKKVPVADLENEVAKIEKIAVVGFHAAMVEGQKAEVVRDLSGSVYIAEAASEEGAEIMTDILFDYLVEDQRYKLISPSDARNVFSRIVDSDEHMEKGRSEVLQEVGERFNSDAVLAGYIYRWRERKGTSIAVERAASVSLDLCLIRPGDGKVLWRGKFDKTQQSLTENLFDAGTFFHGKGQWMTVQELATLGLQKILADMSEAAEENKEKGS